MYAYVCICVVVYTYVCKYSYTCVCLCVLMYMWRPEIIINCLPLSLVTLLFETGSISEPGMELIGQVG